MILELKQPSMFGMDKGIKVLGRILALIILISFLVLLTYKEFFINKEPNYTGVKQVYENDMLYTYVYYDGQEIDVIVNMIMLKSVENKYDIQTIEAAYKKGYLMIQRYQEIYSIIDSLKEK